MIFFSGLDSPLFLLNEWSLSFVFFSQLCFSYLLNSVWFYYVSPLHYVHTGILDWSRVPRLVYSSLPFPRQGAHCSFHTSLAAIFAMFTMMIMHGTGCLVNWWGGLYLFSIVRRRGFSEMWWRAWFWLGAWRDANKCMILLFFVFPFTSFILVILGLFAVQLFYSFVWSK